MKLVKVDGNWRDLQKGYKDAKIQQLLKEFIDSDMDCAEVQDFTYANANSGAAAMRKSARRCGYHQISAGSRQGRLYIYRNDR